MDHAQACEQLSEAGSLIVRVVTIEET